MYQIQEELKTTPARAAVLWQQTYGSGADVNDLLFIRDENASMARYLVRE